MIFKKNATSPRRRTAHRRRLLTEQLEEDAENIAEDVIYLVDGEIIRHKMAADEVN